jgi:hypothetical protein
MLRWSIVSFSAAHQPQRLWEILPSRTVSYPSLHSDKLSAVRIWTTATNSNDDSNSPATALLCNKRGRIVCFAQWTHYNVAVAYVRTSTYTDSPHLEGEWIPGVYWLGDPYTECEGRFYICLPLVFAQSPIAQFISANKEESIDTAPLVQYPPSVSLLHSNRSPIPSNWEKVNGRLNLHIS